MNPNLLSARSAVFAAFLFFGFSFTAHSQQNSSSEKPKTSTSVLDRVKNKAEDGDFIVIPAGQEIKVEPVFPVGSSPTSRVDQGKVVVPVRVGFTTAIPALTKVHLQFTYTSEEGSLYRITAVKINKKLYKVDTDEAPYAASEMRFTLTKPLRIAR
jgi:hypothetical protein